MPGIADMTVRVGADVSDLLTKVDSAKAKLGQLTEENGLLKAELKDLNQSLKNNDSQIAKLNSTISKSTAVTKEDRAAVAALRKERDALALSTGKISATIKQTTAELATNTTQLKAQTVAVKQMESAGTGFAKGATEIYSGLRKIAYIIPGLGIAGLISLISGPLIDAFTEWIKSIDKVTDAQKALQANRQNLNDIYENGNKEAAKEITNLKILYDAATSVNLSMKDRLAAVKGLQNEFPDYFKNIETENILNGRSKGVYDQLTDSIIRTARAKAAVTKIQELSARQLDNEYQTQKILNATTNETNAALIEEKKRLDAATSTNPFSKSNIKEAFESGTNSVIGAINKRKSNALELVTVNNKALQTEIDFITKFIGLGDLAKGVEVDIKGPKVKKEKTIKDVESIDDILKKLGIQIDFLNQKEILLKTSQAKEKISAIESTINTLMQKFKLLADNPIILRLEARVIDIQLTEQFKKILKFDSKKALPTIPLALQLEMLPPVLKFPPGWADEEILRGQILKKLAELGIKKTIPISLGVDITGGALTAGSEDITKNTSTEKLSATLKNALGELKKFNDQVSSQLNSLNASILEGVGVALGNAFSGQGDILKGLFDSIFSVLGSALQQLGKVAIETGLGIKAIKAAFDTLNPFVAIAAGVGLIALGTIIKNSVGQIGGFADGGIIQGPGTGRSDSILARVSKGEYIMPAHIVERFGINFFDKIRGGGMPSFDKNGFPKFAEGGFISPNVIRMANVPQVGSMAIGGGQAIEIFGNFQLRGDKLVAAVNRGNARISRNS